MKIKIKVCGRKCRKKKRDRNETVRERMSESLRMVQEMEMGGERKIGKQKKKSLGVVVQHRGGVGMTDTMCWKREQRMGGRKPALTARESWSRMGVRDS